MTMPAPRQVGSMKLGDHFFLPFTSAEEQRAVLAAYIHDGVRDGHRILYLFDEHPPSEILSRMRMGSARLRSVIERGQLRLVPARQALFPEGRFCPRVALDTVDEAAEQALTEGYEGLRVAGEETWACHGLPGSERAPEFCAMSDPVFESKRMMALCQYDRWWFNPQELAVARDTHHGEVCANDLHNDGVLQISPVFDPYGLVFAGQIDGSRHGAVEKAMDYVLAEDHPSIRLDLSRLVFCDAGGLRAIVSRATRIHPSGRRLVLPSVPPSVARILHVMGWADLPGLVWVEGDSA